MHIQLKYYFNMRTYLQGFQKIVIALKNYLVIDVLHFEIFKPAKSISIVTIKASLGHTLFR